MRPPWRFETKRPSASQKKTNRLLSTSTRDWWYIFFTLGQINILLIFFSQNITFDLVMTGQRSILGEIHVFFKLYKTIATELWQISP